MRRNSEDAAKVAARETMSVWPKLWPYKRLMQLAENKNDFCLNRVIGINSRSYQTMGSSCHATCDYSCQLHNSFKCRFKDRFIARETRETRMAEAGL